MREESIEVREESAGVWGESDGVWEESVRMWEGPSSSRVTVSVELTDRLGSTSPTDASE